MYFVVLKARSRDMVATQHWQHYVLIVFYLFVLFMYLKRPLIYQALC